jgi:hypothetical protein
VAVSTLAWASPVVAALLLAFASGGYFIADWGVASIVLLAILAVMTLTQEVSLGGRWGIAAVSAFGGLAVWQGISSAWALQPSAAINAMNQTVLYVAAFALVLVGVRRLGDLSALIGAALAGSAIVTAYALGGRLLPGLVGGDGLARLSNPISYWNGMGALVAFGALLALGVAGSPGISRRARAGAAALVPMFLLALLLTFSRGAVVALLVGVVVLLTLAPARLETVAAFVTTTIVSVPLIGVANAEDAISGIVGVLPPHEAAGRRILLLLIVTMLAAAGAGAGSSWVLARLPAHRRRTYGIAVATCAAVLVAAIAVVRMPSAGPVGWTKAQIDSFKTFDTQARVNAQSVSDRLAVAAGSGRWQNWGVAVDQFTESPVTGTGAGDYAFYWQKQRDVDLTVVNAHSLYLEVLGESGAIGLALLLFPIGVTLFVAGGFIRRPPSAEAARAVALAIAGATMLGVHAAGDWDWQLPTVMLPAVALAAGALKIACRRAPPAPPAARAGIALAAVLAIALVVGPTMAATTLDDARATAAAGDLTGALDRADAAARLAPMDPAPRLLQANLLADLGRPARSDAAFAAAIARSPHDYAAFADWALALQRRGALAGARAAADRAAELNPRDSRVRFLLADLGGTP